ncbi:hypothetical protein GCM10023144_09760 [Pigmentiphaga soli]|uniref:Uncharacterized protein n=1 Tax=Pigmentiphaga soli TaxID=1007095 RepID=A0ABP8GL72_9BURK
MPSLRNPEARAAHLAMLVYNPAEAGDAERIRALTVGKGR